MKRYKYLLVLMLSILCILSCIFTVFADEAKPYKIGAILEVTGGLSFLGQPAKNTFKMVVDEINKNGGINGHSLELVIYDTEGQPTRAVTFAQKLIKKDKVCAILGPLSSGSALAMIPIIEKAKIPNIALGASRKIVDPPKKWVFSTVQTDINTISRMYKYMQNVAGINKLAIITATDGFGDSGREQLIKLAPNYGIKIVADEKFNSKDSDMTAQLTSIKRTSAQAIVCWTVGPSEAIVTKNWKQLAINVPLYQSHGAASKSFLETAGEQAEGVIFPAPKLIVADQLPESDPQKKILMKYKENYEGRFNQSVSKFGGNAHDAIRIMAEALKEVGENPILIRDYIEKIHDYLGVVGNYNYTSEDHCGLSPDYFVMVQVKNGNWKLLE